MYVFENVDEAGVSTYSAISPHAIRSLEVDPDGSFVVGLIAGDDTTFTRTAHNLETVRNMVGNVAFTKCFAAAPPAPPPGQEAGRPHEARQRKGRHAASTEQGS